MRSPTRARGKQRSGDASERGSDLLRPAGDGPPGEEDEGLPTVSAVVATRDRAALLAPLVAALLDDPDCTEVVVVDDGSSDVTPAVLAELCTSSKRLVTLRVEHVGQLSALACGVAAAHGDVILLLDDDVLPGPRLAAGHARQHAGRTGLVVLGYMPVETGPQSGVPSRLYAAEYESTCREIEAGRMLVLDGLWTGNVSLRRADALAVGVAPPPGWPAYHADRELGYRLRKAGLVVCSIGTFAPSTCTRGAGTVSSPRRPRPGRRSCGCTRLTATFSENSRPTRSSPVFPSAAAGRSSRSRERRTGAGVPEPCGASAKPPGCWVSDRSRRASSVSRAGS